MAAVAQHGHAVAEGPHLAHAVRHEDDCDAVALALRDEAAEPVDVAARQGRSRLVEEQDARPAEQRPRDLDLLALVQVEVAQLVVEVDRSEADPLHVVGDRAPRGAAADLAEPGRRMGQQHIVEDRQIPDHREFLEGGLDAVAVRGPGAVERGVLPKHAERACVGR